MTESEPVPFFGRIGLCFTLFFRVLFDGSFARRALTLLDPPAQLPPAKVAKTEKPAAKPERDLSPALQLLSLLQRQGRLVDFLRQDMSGFSDEDIGTAARVVHEGCRKALESHVIVEPVRSEAEESRVRVEAPVDASQIKLVGNVVGAGPYEGVLRHRGWRAKSIKLPELVGGHDACVLAPAELEL